MSDNRGLIVGKHMPRQEHYRRKYDGPTASTADIGGYLVNPFGRHFNFDHRGAFTIIYWSSLLLTPRYCDVTSTYHIFLLFLAAVWFIVRRIR